MHIVGVPSTTAQKSGALIHHTLGTGDFTVRCHRGVLLRVGIPRHGARNQRNSSDPQRPVYRSRTSIPSSRTRTDSRLIMLFERVICLQNPYTSRYPQTSPTPKSVRNHSKLPSILPGQPTIPQPKEKQSLK